MIEEKERVIERENDTQQISSGRQSFSTFTRSPRFAGRSFDRLSRSVDAMHEDTFESDVIEDNASVQESDMSFENDLSFDFNVLPELNEREINRLDPDLRPSKATINIGKKLPKEVTEFREDDKLVAKINGKGKTVIVLYAVAVIALFALIVFNAIAIFSLSREAAGLESAVASNEVAVASLSRELEAVSDVSFLRSRAVEMGFVEGSGSVSEIVLPDRSVVTEDNSVNTPSNLFDWICDFFIGLFGG